MTKEFDDFFYVKIESHIFSCEQNQPYKLFDSIKMRFVFVESQKTIWM